MPTPLTGNGATFVITGTGAPASIGRVTSIGGISFTGEDFEDVDLATEDLAEYGQPDFLGYDAITLGLVFDPNVHVPIIVGASASQDKLLVGTLTFQQHSSESVPASLTGSGFITGLELGDQSNNARVEGSLTWRWDNKGTPIAFTASTIP